MTSSNRSPVLTLFLSIASCITYTLQQRRPFASSMRPIISKPSSEYSPLLLEAQELESSVLLAAGRETTPVRTRKSFLSFFLFLVGSFLLFTILFQYNPIPQDFKGERFPQSELSEFNVKTHKGFVSMAELNENVYKRFGYEIIEPTRPVPTLRMINELTCETVFADWLKISEEPQPDVPPKTIPSKLHDEFLLYNYAALASWYINDKNSAAGEKPKNWDQISELMKYPKEKLVTYGEDGLSMYHAMSAHRLDGMSGFVVGSMRPWVEVTALTHGASKVLTVEYNNLTIQEEFRDRMSSILPVDFMKQSEKYAGTFDFAASFSSIEHSGMGRYGDPIDPIGDVREVLKIKCMLKKGGLLFLGFPIGIDAVAYNAHRIYGPVRLAMMFYGFEWLDTFSGKTEAPFDLNSERFRESIMFKHVQYTMVLRKL